jgi:Leucine-rich repeat (LRR) protein
MKTLSILVVIFCPAFFFAQEKSYDSIEEGLKTPHSVTILSLIDQNLSFLPDEIASFENLEEIILDESPLLNLDQTFNILSQCKKLKSLSLRECNINVIPPNINLLHNLEELDLSENNMLFFPEPIKTLKKLKKLYFFSTKMSELHFSDNDFPNLEHINLCYNSFDTFPTDLGNLPKLKTIRIWANGMTTIPSSIEKLKYVEEINLDMNKLTSIPKEFSKLNNLKILSLDNNHLYEKSIAVLYDISGIEKLDMSGNKIQTLSPKIKKLTQLKYLDISENPIKELPPEIRKLKKLEQIGLGNLPEMNWESTFDILSGIKSLRRIGMYSMRRKAMPSGFEKLQQIDTFWLTLNAFNTDEQQRIIQLVPNATITFN